MKLQVVFSTANFVYELKKSENFENVVITLTVMLTSEQ